MPKYKIAIFCDSEFWHGKNYKESTDRIGTNSNIGNKRSNGTWNVTKR